MDKKLMGVLAAIGAVAPMSAAQAAVSPAEAAQAMSAGSYAELLRPIPNAASVLKVVDEQPSPPSGEAVRVAQYHHHHHHHHRRHYHHHHHHHHHYY